MKKNSLLVFIFVALPFFVRSQDAAFSSCTSSLLNINPAFTGTALSGRAEMAYRLQWPNIASTYETYMMSYDQFFNGFGVGFNYMYDNEGRGLLQTNRDELDLSYSLGCRKDTSGKAKWVIQPGIAFAFMSNAIDLSKLVLGDMIDPRRGVVYSSNDQPASTKISNLDLSAGLLAYNRSLCLGLAVYHITEPNQGSMGLSKLPMRIVMHGSFALNFGSRFQVIPGMVYMKQQDFEMLQLNMDAHMKNISFGVGYRNLEAFIFSAGYQLKNFSLRYSYDLTLNSAHLAGFTGGTHEIHFSYRFGSDKWMNRQPDLRYLY